MTVARRTERGRLPAFLARTATVVLASFVCAAQLAGQTDYYNTDAGRPVHIEDAYAVERYAFELQAAPLHIERADGGMYSWEVEPEIAYGVLPRTQVEVAFPLQMTRDADGSREVGLGGIDLSVLHNLNAETAGLPAFAVAASVLVPVGNLAPRETFTSLKAIGTRTFRFARIHVNGEYTIGDTPGVGDELGEGSRWLAGVAIDKTFPLRSALVTADVYAEQPLLEDSELLWVVEGGARYQLSPFFALDVGVGRRLTGDEKAWFLTIGAARSFGIRSLFAVPPQ